MTMSVNQQVSALFDDHTSNVYSDNERFDITELAAVVNAFKRMTAAGITFSKIKLVDDVIVITDTCDNSGIGLEEVVIHLKDGQVFLAALTLQSEKLSVLYKELYPDLNLENRSLILPEGKPVQLTLVCGVTQVVNVLFSEVIRMLFNASTDGIFDYLYDVNHACFDNLDEEFHYTLDKSDPIKVILNEEHPSFKGSVDNYKVLDLIEIAAYTFAATGSYSHVNLTFDEVSGLIEYEGSIV